MTQEDLCLFFAMLEELKKIPKRSASCTECVSLSPFTTERMKDIVPQTIQ